MFDFLEIGELLDQRCRYYGFHPNQIECKTLGSGGIFGLEQPNNYRIYLKQSDSVEVIDETGKVIFQTR
ncbi:MAG: hypothetical protein PHN88_02785 [Ignavibacteria bacterium]|nr:hypothetical protein [Ignavibacteria bacterium]